MAGGPLMPTGNPVVDFFAVVGTAIINFIKKKPVTALFRVITGVSAYKSYQAQKSLKNKGPELLLTKYGTGGGMPVLYGVRRVGGTVVFMDTAEEQRELFVVYAFCSGESESIADLRIDNRSITDRSVYRDGYLLKSDKASNLYGSGATHGTPGAEIANILGSAGGVDNPRMVFNLHHGADDQTADPMLTGIFDGTNADTVWTSNHRLRGITYIASNYEFDNNGMFQGIPNLTATIKGRKIYDPRLDSTQTGGSGSHRSNDSSTWEWSSNPALCLLDYLTNDDYGKGLAYSEIDIASFMDSADDCDEDIETVNHGTSVVINEADTTYDEVIVDSLSIYNSVKIGQSISFSSGGTTYFSGRVIGRYNPRIREAGDAYASDVYVLRLEDGSVTTAITTPTTGTLTETQKRFECNAVIDTNETVLENAQDLIRNMRGIFTYTNGKYSLKVEGTETPVLTLDEDDILDAGLELTVSNKETKFNRVEVEFYNAQKNYQADTVVFDHTPDVPNEDDHTYDDGGENLETRVIFPFVTNQRIAYNHAKAILKRSRAQKTISFVATPKVLKAKVGDVVSVTNSNLNLSAEQYRITQMQIQPDLNIAVTAVEYQGDVYGWSSAPDEDINLPRGEVDPYRVEKPTGLNFTNKSGITSAYLSWTDANTYPAYQYRVKVFDDINQGGDVIREAIVQETKFDLPEIPKGTGYSASVTAINTTNNESEAEVLNTFDVTVDTVVNEDIADSAVDTDEINQGAIGGMQFNETKAYYGTGTFNNSNTPFYVDTSSNFSLGNKLSFDGSTLTIDGDGSFSGDISSATGTISNSIQIGSGESVFKADSNGIYLGNETFANAEFSVTPAGALKATSGTIGGFTLGNNFLTAGSATSRIKLSTVDGIHMGNDVFANAPFNVTKSGQVTATDLILKKGNVTYFDSTDGFSAEAIAQIASSLNTRVQTFAFSSENNTDYATIETTEDSQDIKLVVRANASNLRGDGTSEALAIAEIPDNLTIKIEFDDNTSFTSPTTIGSLQTFNASTDGTPLSSEYEIETLDLSELGGDFSAFVLGNQGAVNTSGDIVYTVSSYTVATAGTYYFRVIYDTTDTSYNATNDPESLTRSLEIEDLSGSGFLISNGSSGAQTSDAVTLTGTQTISGAKTFSATTTFSGDVNISGDLSVTGTTTTIDTATLNVEDKNITLNYATGDSSSTADGAGITIQDAVNSTTDATILWDATNDEFDFSHPINITGAITSSGTITVGDSHTIGDDVNDNLEIASSTGENILINSANQVYLQTGGSTKLETTASGISVTGTVTATSFSGDGSGLTGVGGAVDINGTPSANALTYWHDADTIKGSTIFDITGGGAVLRGAGGSGFEGTFRAEDTDGTNQYIDFDPQGLTSRNNTSNGAIKFIGYNGTINTTYGGFDASGNFEIGTTDVIQAGTRNLVNIGTINSGAIDASGVIDGVGGNATTPSYIFEGDTNTGLFHPAADTIGFSTAGTTALTLDSSQNATFAGTIDSGAITSSGNLHAGDGTDISMDAGASGQLQVDGNGYDGAIALDASAMHLYHNSSSRSLVLGTNETARLTIGGLGGFNFHSNNLSSVGTISSKTILMSSATGTYQAGSLGYTDSNWGFLYRPPQAGAFGAHLFEAYDGTDLLKIEESGNATFSGSINSGAITSSFTNYTWKINTYTVDQFLDTAGGWARSYRWYNTNSTAETTTMFFGALGDASGLTRGYWTVGDPTSIDATGYNTSNGIVLLPTGNVGIGTSSPLMKLHVNTSGTSGLTGVANRGMIITDSVGARLVLEDTGATSNRKNFMLRSESDAFTISGLNDAGTAFTTENMLVITGSSGDVGIGKVNPAQKLDVQGNIGVGGTQVIDSSRNLTNIGTISSGAITANQFLTLNASGTGDTSIEIGANTASNHYAYIDLVGDATYADYGLRIIRNNGGANTSSFIYHRGTGNFNIETQDSASIKLRTAGVDALTLNTTQDATFAGSIFFSGTTRIRSDNGVDFLRSSSGSAQEIKVLKAYAGVSYASAGAGDGQFDALNGYRVGGQEVITSARALTNIADITTSGSVYINTVNDGLYFSGGNNRIYFTNYRAMEGNTSGTRLQVGEGYSNTQLYGNVGIGVSDPASQLELVKNNSTAISSGTAPHGIALSYGAADGYNAGLWFSPSFGDDQGIAGISSQRVSGYQTDLRFYTNNTNSARAFSQRMQIDKDGNLLVGGGTLSHTYGTSGRGLIEIIGTSTALLALKANTSVRGYVYGSTTNMEVFSNVGDLNLYAHASSSIYAKLSTTGLFLSHDLYPNGSTSARLSQNNPYLRCQTASGYLDFGPANSSYSHFYTDRPEYYFNVGITVDTGIVQSYNENLSLRRAGSTSNRFEIGDGTSYLFTNLDFTNASQTGSNKIHLQRAGGITFYGDTNENHGIFSRDSNGTENDDIRINSYGSVILNLDSNNNNSTSANFTIGRHGGSAGSVGTALFEVNGETGRCYSTHFEALGGSGFYTDSSGIIIDGSGGTSGQRVYVAPGYSAGTATTYQDIRVVSGQAVDHKYSRNTSGSYGYKMEYWWDGDSYQSIRQQNDAFRFSVDVIAFDTSDKRLKNNIKPIENCLDKVSKLGAYEFEWDETKQRRFKGFDTGVIAQEVEAIYPHMIEDREDGYKALQYEKLVPLLLGAIKELKAEIEELKK